MNNAITSRESILSVCKDIVIESGMSALNVRNIAKRSGVALGTVYNYFPSKEDLIIATVESIWTEIMSHDTGENLQLNFLSYVNNLFNNVKKGYKKYPLFLIIHSMTMMDMDKNKGREVMNRFFENIENRLLESLNQDQSVKSGIFNESFSKQDYVKFVFSNILTLIINRTTTCDFLLAVIRRTIYE
jgi:AcrR family transcriptional regulator